MSPFPETEEDSRVDYVIGLTRHKLIAEVFTLENRLKEVEAKMEAERDEKLHILELYNKAVDRNEARLDELMEQSASIVAQRLGLSSNSSPSEQKEMKPIRSVRKPWAVVAAGYEKKVRDEYWKKRIGEVEEADKAKEAVVAKVE